MDADHVAGVLVETVVSPAIVVTFFLLRAQSGHVDLERLAALACTRSYGVMACVTVCSAQLRCYGVRGCL